MENKGYGAHVLALSYPSQGHPNPLASKGIRATFAITHFIFKTMQPKSSASIQFDKKYQMAIMTNEGSFHQSESLHAYLTRLKAIGLKT